MSYDLYFWRQSPDVTHSPNKLLELLSEDQPVEGVTRWPRTSVRQLLKDAFPEIEEGDFELTWEFSGSYFQIHFAHANERDVQLIIALCSYNLLDSPEVLNRLIDTCGQLGCALYDPQTGERYDQPEPAEMVAADGNAPSTPRL
jgi:hypothetical protein